MTDDLLSAAEINERYGVDRRTLTRWENAGALDGIRTLTGHRRYRGADVERVLAARAQTATEPEAAAPEPEPEKPKSPRRLALEALHAADVSGTDAADELRALGANDTQARALVEGVRDNRDELDAVIRATAENWALERMPFVDRNVLRLAVYELRFTDVATADAITEAVGLARLLSTEDSGRFVNGVLGRVARERHGAR